MIENIVESFILNAKKYIFALVGFIIGILFIEYGFLKAVFIIILSFIGYNLGNKTFIMKIKQLIKNRLND